MQEPVNSILNFKNNFNGGTRANRFAVIPAWPNNLGPTQKEASFTIVSASLPAAQINSITVPFRGRQIVLAGERIYNTWTIGVYDDNNQNLKNLWYAFHQWVEKIDGNKTHLVDVDSGDFSYDDLQTDWIVRQLDVYGTENTNPADASGGLKGIKLINCWPSMVGEINLDTADSGFCSFSVTLTFDHIEII